MRIFKNFLLIIVMVWISVLSIFGMCKLGGYMFDLNSSKNPNASDTADGETCWSKGGVPQYDTRGGADDFMDCKFK